MQSSVMEKYENNNAVPAHSAPAHCGPEVDKCLQPEEEQNKSRVSLESREEEGILQL